MAYQAVDEIMARCEKDSVEFWKAVQLEDCEENGISEEESWNQMTHMWNSMKESVAAYDPEAISRSGLVGREGKLMDAYREQGKPLCGDFVSKVIANAALFPVPVFDLTNISFLSIKTGITLLCTCDGIL